MVTASGFLYFSGIWVCPQLIWGQTRVLNLVYKGKNPNKNQ